MTEKPDYITDYRAKVGFPDITYGRLLTRAEAKAAGMLMYEYSRPCHDDPRHPRIRYVKDNSCVVCRDLQTAREKAEAELVRQIEAADALVSHGKVYRHFLLTHPDGIASFEYCGPADFHLTTLSKANCLCVIPLTADDGAILARWLMDNCHARNI